MALICCFFAWNKKSDKIYYSVVDEVRFAWENSSLKHIKAPLSLRIPPSHSVLLHNILCCNFSGKLWNKLLLICFHFSSLLLSAEGLLVNLPVTEMICTVEILSRVNHSLIPLILLYFIFFLERHSKILQMLCLRLHVSR